MKLKATNKWIEKPTRIAPVYFPTGVQWKDLNSCSIFCSKIEDFTIPFTTKVIVILCKSWWVVRYKWYRYYRHQLPHKIKSYFTKPQLPF